MDRVPEALAKTLVDVPPLTKAAILDKVGVEEDTP